MFVEVAHVLSRATFASCDMFPAVKQAEAASAGAATSLQHSCDSHENKKQVDQGGLPQLGGMGASVQALASGCYVAQSMSLRINSRLTSHHTRSLHSTSLPSPLPSPSPFSQEKRLISDIKKFAKQQQMGSVKIMAKDLVRTRQYITKFIEMRSHLNGASLKLQTVKSHQALAESMSSVAKAMVKMNKAVNVPAINKMMQDFARENEKSELMQEMMGDAMDDVMDQDGNEEEEEMVVSQVLDEIGVSFGDEMMEAPGKPVAVAKGKEQEQEIPAAPVGMGAAEGGGDMSELEQRLNNLRR